MATYDVFALRNMAPKGVRGGGRGRGASRALNNIWVDKVTIDVDRINDHLETPIAAGDTIEFSEVRRDQVLLQGVLLVHKTVAAANSVQVGYAGDLDALLVDTSLSNAYTAMVSATSTPKLVTKPSSGTRKITLEFESGASAGAVFTLTWVWLDVEVDDQFYGV